MHISDNYDRDKGWTGKYDCALRLSDESRTHLQLHTVKNSISLSIFHLCFYLYKPQTEIRDNYSILGGERQ